MIRILLADDHEIVRTGLRLTLSHISDIEIVAEAKTGSEAVLLAQQLKPDIVLMDMNMPDTDGFSACVQLLHNAFAFKILVISGQENSVLMPRLLEMGASGYVSKDTPPEELQRIIRAVYAGEKLLDAKASIKNKNSPFHLLSDRELQVALMVARGMESNEIADRLFLSRKTVHGYHRELLKKLGIKKDVELTHLALKHGLLDLDSVQSIGKK